MTDYIVDFGDEKSSAFVRLAMAQVEANGARLREGIVRCRDCARAVNDSFGCMAFSHYEIGSNYGWTEVPAEVEPDGFCAWGERKEQNGL